MENKTTTIYLVRHPESTANIQPDIIGGRSDHVGVTPRGWKQVYALTDRFLKEGITFDAGYTSPSLRAVSLIEPVFERLGLPLDMIVKDERLVERSQGDWEALTRDQCYTPQVLYEMNVTNPLHFKAPSGESQYEVANRMYEALTEIVNSQYERVFVASHGNAIKSVLAKILGSNPAMTWKIRTDNTSITELVYDEKGWNILRVADAAHLYEVGSLRDRTPKHKTKLLNRYQSIGAVV